MRCENELEGNEINKPPPSLLVYRRIMPLATVHFRTFSLGHYPPIYQPCTGRDLFTKQQIGNYDNRVFARYSVECC